MIPTQKIKLKKKNQQGCKKKLALLAGEISSLTVTFTKKSSFTATTKSSIVINNISKKQKSILIITFAMFCSMSTADGTY